MKNGREQVRKSSTRTSLARGLASTTEVVTILMKWINLLPRIHHLLKIAGNKLWSIEKVNKLTLSLQHYYGFFCKFLFHIANSHVKTFKMTYTRCLYNNPISSNLYERLIIAFHGFTSFVNFCKIREPMIMCIWIKYPIGWIVLKQICLKPNEFWLKHYILPSLIT